MKRLLRRLLFTLSLVAGADLLLFLTFHSGIFGDPAAMQLGAKASAAELGHARVRMGLFEAFEANAIRLRLVSVDPEFRLRIVAEKDALQLLEVDGSALGRIDLQGQVQDVASRLVTWSGEGWQLQAFCLQEVGQEDARGIASALGDSALRLQAGRPTELGWARPRPLLQRFQQDFFALLRFDFGYDREGREVLPQLWDRGSRSLALSLPAFLLTTLLALWMALGAARRPSRRDRFFRLTAVVVMSTSSLVWILFLRQWLLFDLELFPLRPWSAPVLPLLALPILIWVFLSVWPDFLLYRSLVRERAAEDWMRTATANGVPRRRMLWRHLLPNLLGPVLALLSLTLPFLVLGSLLLEHVFDIPGLGNHLLEAIRQRDLAVLRALTFLFAVAFLFAQWLGEAVAMAFDPRLRSSVG